MKNLAKIDWCRKDVRKGGYMKKKLYVFYLHVFFFVQVFLLKENLILKQQRLSVQFVWKLL